MPQAINLLIVEDEESDVILTKRALKRSRLKFNVSVAKDGREAIDLLEKEDLPKLILLDIHLPVMNGHEVLKYIKNDARLKRIPVVVLSGSDVDEDFAKCYQLHANCCVKKARTPEEFSNIVKSVEEFWFRVVKLPPI